jgi:hypothetical protein
VARLQASAVTLLMLLLETLLLALETTSAAECTPGEVATYAMQ